MPSVFARVGRTGGSPASVPGKYKGPIGPVDRRETTVLAFMYVTLVTLIACGISPEAAVAGATTAGAAAARLLGLL